MCYFLKLLHIYTVLKVQQMFILLFKGIYNYNNYQSQKAYKFSIWEF